MPENEAQQVEAFKKTITVLVVDDEESLRGILSETIEEAGLRVDTAGSAEEALEKFQNKTYAVVLSDIRMPGMSGIELLQAIKTQHPETEVVIMTSYASMDTAVGAIRAGAYDYLMKPFNNLEDVVGLINRVVDKIFLRYENIRLIRELQKSNLKLVEKNRETKTLYNFSQFLSQTLDMDEVLKLALSCFSQLGDGFAAVCLNYDEGKLIINSSYPDSVAEVHRDKAIVSLENMQMEELMAWFHNINSDQVFRKTVALHFQTDSFFAAPLFASSKPFGVLLSLGRDGEEFPLKIGRLLNQFSQMVAVAVDNASLHQQMKDNAIKDGLTGLFNHRYFQERLVSEASRALRHEHPVSLIFVDVDHFKTFNDTNGHPMGDAVLKGVSKILKEKSRQSDVVARYGGEEFVVILPETPKQGALTRAEELRKEIENHTFPGGENQPMGRVTVSLGVSESPTDAKDVKELLKQADAALYFSKENGRNQVTGFRPDLPSEKKGDPSSAGSPPHSSAQA